MHCIPTCTGCTQAGICSLTGQVPAPVSAKRYAPRRAVTATYPRDVQQVYVHLACGHISTKEAQVFYSVWRPRDDEELPRLYCEVCHGWTVAEVKLANEPSTLPNF